MRFETSYSPNADPASSEKRPFLKVQLLGDNGAMMDESAALVDTGAVDTMVDADYALDLGIDLSGVPSQKIYGIGKADIKAKPSKVRMKLLRSGEEIELPVLFVYDSYVDVILGKKGFLDRYIAKFDLRNELFYITKPR